MHFAAKVSSHLNEIFAKEKEVNQHGLRKSREYHFANRETKTEIDESIRYQDVYIFQDVENHTTGLSVDENIRAIYTAIDATKRADAHYITAVIPVFPYARQDKQVSREGITAAMIARELEDAGATRVITLDVHNAAIYGFFRKALFENLHASKNILDYASENIDTANLVVTAPDIGGITRARHYAERLQKQLVLVYKQRDYTRISGEESNITTNILVGEVKGKNILLVDDMIATGGTMIEGAKLLKENGAGRIYAAASLPLFSGNAVEKFSKASLEDKVIDLVIGTDAVYHGEELTAQPWYAEVSVAKYFARVIYNLNHGSSISELLR